MKHVLPPSSITVMNCGIGLINCTSDKSDCLAHLPGTYSSVIFIWKGFYHRKWKEGKFGPYSMKRALISRHLGFLSLRNAQTVEPTTAWTAVSFLSASTRYWFLHFSGAGRALWANSSQGSAKTSRSWLGPMSISSELGHLAVPINFLAWGKNQMAQANFEHGTSGSRVLENKPTGK